MQAHGFSSNPSQAEPELELKLTNTLSESRSPYVIHPLPLVRLHDADDRILRSEAI